MLKGALHTHTTCSDGDLPPEMLLGVYRDLGFDFVALTDHDFLLKSDAYRDVPDEFKGMVVFKGIERTLHVWGYVHVSQIFGVEDVLHVFNHPAAYGFGVELTPAVIRQLELFMPIDAVEVTSNGFYTPEYDIDAIPYPKVASDDSHTRDACGRAWIEVSCKKDKDAIIRAIRRGKALIRYNGTAPLTGWKNEEEANGR